MLPFISKRGNMLKIGTIQLDNPFVLAPLAGVTDLPMRRLCKEQGASMVFSEMISAKGLWYKDKGTERLLATEPEEAPMMYQLFGSEPEIMAYAARELKDRANAGIDINMGCPVPKVVKNGEGSALLKTPDLLYDIVKAVVDNAGKPVTGKIRIGWDDDSINAVEIAKAIEAAGAAAVSVHGRTRMQYYSGNADWDMIRQVKEAVKIPVIGNGDVVSPEAAERMLKETGCDGVMIGRGSQGNPWIFHQILHWMETGEHAAKPTLEEMKQMILRHARLQVECKGEYIGMREMRKHVAWYTTGYPNSAKLRAKVNEVDTLEQLKDLIGKL